VCQKCLPSTLGKRDKTIQQIRNVAARASNANDEKRTGPHTEQNEDYYEICSLTAAGAGVQGRAFLARCRHRSTEVQCVTEFCHLPRPGHRNRNTTAKHKGAMVDRRIVTCHTHTRAGHRNLGTRWFGRGGDRLPSTFQSCTVHMNSF